MSNQNEKATQKARAFLERVEKTETLIQNKITEKEQWQALALATTSRLTEDKVQSTPNPQRKNEAMDTALDVEAEIHRLIGRLVYEKRDVARMIEQLPAIEYDTLHRMYLLKYEIKDIARHRKRSYDWAKNMHYRALVHLQELLNKDGR